MKADKRIDLLFARFAAIYGHIWRSQFKDEDFLGFAKKEWQDVLGRYSDAVLTKAILVCREFYELPPTLPQMLKCCKDAKKQLLGNEQSNLNQLQAALNIAQGDLRHFRQWLNCETGTIRDQFEAIVKTCQMKVTQLEEEIRNASSQPT